MTQLIWFTGETGTPVSLSKLLPVGSGERVFVEDPGDGMLEAGALARTCLGYHPADSAGPLAAQSGEKSRDASAKSTAHSRPSRSRSSGRRVSPRPDAAFRSS